MLIMCDSNLMKKNVLKVRSLINCSLLVWSVLFLFIVSSCRSTDAENLSTVSGPALISVRLERASFEDLGTIGNTPASAKGMKAGSVSKRAQVQHSRLSFNKDFDLVAELTPVSSDTSVVAAGVRKLSSVDQGDLNTGIKYTLVVFAENGEYVTERDYVYGEEASAPVLELNGGSKYTFIVYSVNNKTTNSEVVFSDPNNKTLATATVRDLVGNSDDFMYFREDMIVSGDSPNYLGVVLKHMFSQVTTTIDASEISYNVLAVTGALNPNYELATVNLSDGLITRSGNQIGSATDFQVLNAPSVTSLPSLVNNSIQGSGYYLISSLTVGLGPYTRTGSDLRFDGLSFTPGVKYKLNIKLTTNDDFITHENQPAVRIGGQIWMRHNLGVNTTLDPDQVPSIQALHGNFYQWGRNKVVATAYNFGGAIPGWDRTVVLPANLWNLGSEAFPIKAGAADPCPTGYRVPTKTEYQQLINATVQSNIGSYVQNVANFSAGKVFTSRSNTNVKLTFPIGGNLYDVNGTITVHGGGGYNWTSSSANSQYDYFCLLVNTVSVLNQNPAWGMRIRCIAE